MSTRHDGNRSASEGNLAAMDKPDSDNFECGDAIPSDFERQALFTLPRWMSQRRKRNKVKNIKVDVPFTSHRNTLPSESLPLTSETLFEGKPTRPTSFIRKLFRNSSFFASKNGKHRYKNLPKITPISSSNSDMRNITNHSFDYQEYFKDKVPALCGIRNHGNTCFMNAVIQCLSNSDIFAEYFVMNHYKMDIQRRNKAHSKRYGTRGEVPEQLGALLKSLWSCSYYPSISEKFKTLVAKHGRQYEGNDQHDAQEFLLWLLDKVHEDLNTAAKQKYKKTKGNLGRSDEDIASETLANHLRCNNSFIQDLFQGQMRSSLCCLGCGRSSNTFDPYICISLPIVQTDNIPLILRLVYMKRDKKPVKIGVLLENDSTVCDLRERISSKFGTSKANVVLLEILDGEFNRTYCDRDHISSFKDSEGIFAIEMPTHKPNRSSEKEKLTLLIANEIQKENMKKLVWWPFVHEVDRDTSYQDLEKEIFNTMRNIFKTNLEMDTENCYSFSIVSGDPENETICSSVDMPLYMPAIDKALSLCVEGIQHVKLIVEWKITCKDILLETEKQWFEVHPSVSNTLNSKKSSEDVTLHDCFDFYFNEETLASENAWMCPYCQHRLPCAKKLSLWTTPDILIVHLKRFRQSSTQRMKITTFVDFPATGLDMNPHVSARNQNGTAVHVSSPTTMALWSPWKRSRSRSGLRWEDNVYELNAVCNHHGSMQGGHYTAYARNPISGHWYVFDDMRVQEVPVKDVISADAYILFYQRTSLSQSCASSSSSGYSSASSGNSVGVDHWAFRMAPFFRDSPVTSKSHDDLFDVGKTASLDRRTFSSQRSIGYNSKSYSTILDEGNKTTSLPRERICRNEEHEEKLKTEIEIPPPPPPARLYWTVTSV